MTVQSWPAGTVVMLATQGDGPYVIPVSAALRAPNGDVLLALGRSRGSLVRLQADPRVALLVLAAENIAVTIYGHAAVVDEPFVDGVTAVRVNVERVVGHERASFVIESGVAWRWTDESAQARDAEVHAALARLARSG
jgi:hypothetical protein